MQLHEHTDIEINNNIYKYLSYINIKTYLQDFCAEKYKILMRK